jgi:competence ComEA-like helix-hairpin-helix protein
MRRRYPLEKIFLVILWCCTVFIWLAAQETGGDSAFSVLHQESAELAGKESAVPVPGPNVADSILSGEDKKGTAVIRANCIDINTAGKQDLIKLPGIGPVLADRILEFRSSNGPFRAADDLDKVKGIGPAKMDKMRGLICRP